MQILRGLVILQASSTIHERCGWETWQQRCREQQAPAGILPTFESSDAKGKIRARYV